MPLSDRDALALARRLTQETLSAVMRHPLAREEIWYTLLECPEDVLATLAHLVRAAAEERAKGGEA